MQVVTYRPRPAECRSAHTLELIALYNLLVGLEGTVDHGRLFEHTEQDLVSFVAPGGVLNPRRIESLPALMMPERGHHEPQVARVGHVIFSPGTRTHHYRFSPTLGLPDIPISTIEESLHELGFTSEWELQRTHWAVKDVDLYRVLHERLLTRPKESVFKMPEWPQQEDLVAVMMPFEASFTATYDAIQGAASAVAHNWWPGLECKRVDDIWKNDAIMDDVIDLIVRAKVVISDLSGKNANVFYETGIAHALRRDVIVITRSDQDVPFDLRHLRYVPYFSNGEGLRTLQSTLVKRLSALSGA